MEISRLLSDLFTDRVLVLILLAGLLLVAIAYCWLAVRAIKASKWWLVGLIPPVAVLYLLSGSRRVIAPLAVFVAGAALAVLPFVATRYVVPLLPRHSWEKVVGDKLHVTLTGLADFPYASLQSRPQIAVLQMANADVTNETLDNLAGMSDLEELDISSSAIDDAGLAKLAKLPKLAALRLAHVHQISDDGFRQHLFQLNQLKELDARDTAIKRATLVEWKKAQLERSYLK